MDEKTMSHYASSNLTDQVRLSGWVTPSSRDWKDTVGMATEATNPDGSVRNRVDQLPRQAAMAGWPTPRSTESGHATGNPDRAMDQKSRLEDTVFVAGWVTPSAANHKGATSLASAETAIARQGQPTNLPEQVICAIAELPQPVRLTASGQILTGSSAEMESGGQLNPRFSGYLMGYPPIWCIAAILAQRAIRLRKTKKPDQ